MHVAISTSPISTTNGVGFRSEAHERGLSSSFPYLVPRYMSDARGELWNVKSIHI